MVITFCQSSIEATDPGVAWSRSFGPLVNPEVVEGSLNGGKWDPFFRG